MKRSVFRGVGLMIASAVLAVALYQTAVAYLPSTADLPKVRAMNEGRITHELTQRGFRFGAPVFIRIFKESSELELWVKKDNAFELHKIYEICNYSGALGPKLKEGDLQSPEGFYSVATEQLNPNSSFHLSFNLGFPNAFDASKGRTGSFLMVHGKCVSIGCYAMTDAGIEEIYLLVEAALNGGQSNVPVHAFPFRMTDQNMQRHDTSKWLDFWQNLKQGYDSFEATRTPPKVNAVDGTYVFSQPEG